MSIFSKIFNLFENESSRMEKEINENFYKLISNEANNNLVIDNDIFKYTFEKISNKKAKKQLDINITHRINSSLDNLTSLARSLPPLSFLARFTEAKVGDELPFLVGNS